MTPTQTVHYLQNDGRFFGARVIGSEQVVFLQKNAVIVQIGENDRMLTVDQFETEFANSEFRKIQPTEAGS